jgi:hypothetical protein
MNIENHGEERGRMDCAEFRDVLHELDRPGTRGASELEGAMSHAESCGDCAALLVEEESLNFGLSKIARETVRMPGAARVEAALLKEFRQATPEIEPVMISARRNVQRRIAALAVAAAVLFALGTAIYERNLRRSTVTPVMNAASQAQLTDPGRTADNSSSAVTATPAATTTPTTDASTNPPGASDAEGTEYATEFVRLPYADDPAGLEGGSVVRVTLARSALESYGLPAEGLGMGDRVTADMLVSEDGTPQAIRLVDED